MEAINNDKNCKTLWRHLKDLNSTTGHDIDMITYEDKNLTDKIYIVNCLNDHFSSVGEKLIPHPHSNFESEKINNYVKSKINDNTLFSLYTVTNADVFKYLSNLDINKSTGTDGVGPRILKVSKSIIVDSLTHIINLSLCTGIFPDILKYAKVTPIFKAVHKQHVEDNSYLEIACENQTITTHSQIHDKTDAEGDNTLYIAGGSRWRKSHYSRKEENNASCTVNSIVADDNDDDGLKYNMLYVSSERHDDIDVNYSTADGDTPRLISCEDEGCYSSVDDTKIIQNSNSYTHEVTNTDFEFNEDNSVDHVNAPTERGCVYAVVDKSHKTNSSVKNIENASSSATYAVVDKRSETSTKTKYKIKQEQRCIFNSL
ncbi:unnamed protein product [Mytilus edulis]|uniref:Uncharacterized protein n=1 Tax=Mytilus edulis TaxID=6550 RepID=A0A8S3SC21_MYTED|nr:unnamed protein product [Mytilus edulis]